MVVFFYLNFRFGFKLMAMFVNEVLFQIRSNMSLHKRKTTFEIGMINVIIVFLLLF